jgi:hypothetical protein
LFETYDQETNKKDVEERLDAFAEFLKDNPTFGAYIISYAGRRACRGEALQRAKTQKHPWLQKARSSTVESRSSMEVIESHGPFNCGTHRSALKELPRLLKQLKKAYRLSSAILKSGFPQSTRPFNVRRWLPHSKPTFPTRLTHRSAHATLPIHLVITDLNNMTLNSGVRGE